MILSGPNIASKNLWSISENTVKLDAGSALYILGSFFNHSSSRNCERSSRGKLLVVRACKHIKQGEECTLTYRQVSQIHSTRSACEINTSEISQWEEYPIYFLYWLVMNLLTTFRLSGSTLVRIGYLLFGILLHIKQGCDYPSAFPLQQCCKIARLLLVNGMSYVSKGHYVMSISFEGFYIVFSTRGAFWKLLQAKISKSRLLLS